MSDVNLLTAAVAALTSFLLGGLWYSPVMFLNSWAKESKVDPRTNESGRHPAFVFGTAYALAFIAAVVFALLLGANASLAQSLQLGLMVGLGLVAGSFGINYLFGGQSFKLWLINAGYHAVQFFLYGLVFGCWPK